MQYAIAELGVGVGEIHGPASNRRIMDYARSVDLQAVYTNDDIPWAGLFTAFVLKSAGFQLPGNPLRERNWADWGEAINEPKFGALAVFWRQSPESGLGHVGFVVDIEEGSLSILGGNQNDSVRIGKFPRDRLLALRMPPTNR
jgi:uncharacterized protein (TIGR02594 family)